MQYRIVFTTAKATVTRHYPGVPKISDTLAPVRIETFEDKTGDRHVMIRVQKRDSITESTCKNPVSSRSFQRSADE